MRCHQEKASDRAGGGGRQAPRILRLCRCPDRSGARHPPGAGRAPHRRRDGGRAGGVRGNLRLLLRRHGVGERVLLRRPAVLCLPPPVRACGWGTAGEKHIGFCPGGWTGSGGVPRPVGRRGRCRTIERPGYISGNLPPAGLPLRKGGAGNHWQTLRFDAESFRLPDRPAGGGGRPRLYDCRKSYPLPHSGASILLLLPQRIHRGDPLSGLL